MKISLIFTRSMSMVQMIPPSLSLPPPKYSLTYHVVYDSHLPPTLHDLHQLLASSSNPCTSNLRVGIVVIIENLLDVEINWKKENILWPLINLFLHSFELPCQFLTPFQFSTSILCQSHLPF